MSDAIPRNSMLWRKRATKLYTALSQSRMFTSRKKKRRIVAKFMVPTAHFLISHYDREDEPCLEVIMNALLAPGNTAGCVAGRAAETAPS